MLKLKSYSTITPFWNCCIKKLNHTCNQAVILDNSMGILLRVRIWPCFQSNSKITNVILPIQALPCVTDMKQHVQFPFEQDCNSVNQ